MSMSLISIKIPLEEQKQKVQEIVTFIADEVCAVKVSTLNPKQTYRKL